MTHVRSTLLGFLTALAWLALGSQVLAQETLTGVRLSTSGALDRTFGNSTVRFDVPGSTVEALYDVVTTTGKVLGVGFALVDGVPHMLLVRFTSTGALDLTFDGDGYRIVPLPARSVGESAVAVAIDSAGRIVVAGAGTVTPETGPRSAFLVARFLGNGALDSSFGNGGRVLVDFGVRSQALAVALTTDRIVVGGPVNESAFAVARLHSNGTLDTSFSGDGKDTTTFTGYSGAFPWDIACDSLGRVVIAGEAHPEDDGTKTVMVVARHTTSGALDTTFSGDGRQVVSFTSQNDEWARAIAIDGTKIVLAGGSVDTSNVVHMAMARLNANGSLDTTFEQDGKVVVAGLPGMTAAQITDIVRDSSGRFVVSGLAGNPSSGTMFAVARFRSDGTLDTSYSGDGSIVINWTETGYDHGEAITLDENGKAVVVGLSR